MRHPSTEPRPRGSVRVFLSVLAALVLVLGGAIAAAPSSAFAGPPKPTVVSLTFDDGSADQLMGAGILGDRGLVATYYVPSGLIGSDSYLTETDLHGLVERGNEIGSHTVNHVDLSRVSAAEAIRQVCQDRRNLTDLGLEITSFAYPFGGYSAHAAAAASECGLSSARMLGGLESHAGCVGCGTAESIPPADPFNLRAPAQVDSDVTLDDLVALVGRAMESGGWLPITFHRVCEAGCSPIGITPELLTEFADYLQGEVAAGRLSVETIGEVVGGDAAPVRDDWDRGRQPADGNRIDNPGFETWDRKLPQCWEVDRWGSNTVDATRSSAPLRGDESAQITMSDSESGSAAYMQGHDLGECSPAARAGETFDVAASYTSDVVVQFVVHLRTERGTWEYWDSSPWFAPSEDVARAKWTTRAVPSGYSGIAVGLSIFGDGTLTVDDLSLVAHDAVPTPTPTRTADPEPTPTTPPASPSAPESDVPDSGDDGLAETGGAPVQPLALALVVAATGLAVLLTRRRCRSEG